MAKIKQWMLPVGAMCVGALIISFLVFKHFAVAPAQPHFDTPEQIAQKETITQTVVSSVAAQLSSSSAQSSSSAAPKQLSLGDANKQYGPCAVVPTLMYHHVEDYGQATTEHHQQLTVDPKFFHAQLQYLHDHHYTVITMQQLVDFFDRGISLPSKPVLLTFDDGYVDFATTAVPILNQFQDPGTLFTPTGLIENPDYLTWAQIKDIAGSGRVLFANHTWSHHSMGAANAIIEREITLADTQLRQRGYDAPKIFAYPYGNSSPYAEKFLNAQGYLAAFTTRPGTIQCKGQRFELPRTRIGNASLSLYGL